jgi:hypothetical protein
LAGLSDFLARLRGPDADRGVAGDAFAAGRFTAFACEVLGFDAEALVFFAMIPV